MGRRRRLQKLLESPAQVSNCIPQRENEGLKFQVVWGFFPHLCSCIPNLLEVLSRLASSPDRRGLVLPLSLLKDILELSDAWLVFIQVWIRRRFILP